MRGLKRVVGVALALGLANVGLVASPAAAAGGPVVLLGIDAEDGGPGAHGPVSVYVTTLNNGILNSTSNGGTGILVIGGGKDPGDNVTQFWNAVSAGTGVPVSYVNGPAVATQSFGGFEMLAVASSVIETPLGGLTQAENDTLAGRQSAVAAFVNGGGGLFGTSQAGLTNPYAYLTGVGGFSFNFTNYSDITPTGAGTNVGITNALDVCCWHDEYASFPSFLSVLAVNAATGNAAALGGGNVVVPTGITLNPANDSNPVGSQHTVTASVLGSNGQPLAGVLVSFSVGGANNGAGGFCSPGSCHTNANGQVSFTYTGTNVGNDTIVACFTTQAGGTACATASKNWFSTAAIFLNDVAVNEGNGGLTPATFTVSLSQPAPAGGVTVLASTANGSAVAPGDYLPRTNVLISFPPGATSEPFTVQVVNDNIHEGTETYSVLLHSPTNAVIADGLGVGTIFDNDHQRNGAFSCRASAVRLLGAEPVVANPANVPCADDAESLLNLPLTSGLLTVASATLNAITDQTPDNLQTTFPAATDAGLAASSVERATVSALGLVTIRATAVAAQARVQCTAGPFGLVPTLSSSSTIASLTINGQPLNVLTNGVVNLPLGLGTVQLNRTVTTAGSITRQAVRIVLLGQEIVLAEAQANFSGSPCS